MISKILGTTGTRILNAAFNMIILIVLTRQLGSTGYGTIVLVVLAMAVLQLIMDLITGSGIIYYASRRPLWQLLLPAYGWIMLVTVFYGLLLRAGTLWFPEFTALVIPPGLGTDVGLLAMLNGLMMIHYNILIGEHRIKAYNIIFFIQIMILTGTVMMAYPLLGMTSVNGYLTALYLAFGTGTVLGFTAVIWKRKPDSLKGWKHTTREVFRYGFTSQVANLLHLGNKRFSVWILKSVSGLASVGVYGAGQQLSEGLRLVGQSISLVQFSAIASKDKGDYARELTIRLMKLTLLVTLAALIILWIIPLQWYLMIFKPEFTAIKSLVFALSPGVMALAANTILSGYFAGTGQPGISVRVNALGFAVTLAGAFVLIPLWSFIGAALTASLSYTATVLWQLIIFRRQTGTRFRQWLPDATDRRLLRELLANKSSG